MNAHSHMDFTENARDSRGRFIPRPADDATEASSQYTATIRHSAGGYGAGDKFVFDPEIEPGAGDIVGLRHFEAELRNGVQIGRLITHLPTARWADMPFGDAWGESAHTFAFQALEDDTPEIIDMARLVGIDLCVEVQRAEEADDAAPKQAKPTPPRDSKGRFFRPGFVTGRHQLELVESLYGDGAIRFFAQPIASPWQRFSFGFQLEGDGSDEGQRDFAGLRRATGVLNPTDSSELHFKAFWADIEIKDGDYKLSNFERVAPDADEENEERRERGLRDRLNMEGPAFELEFLWALLEPYIEDQLGDRKGPYDFVLDGKELPVRAESLRVIGAKEAEVMHFHLVRLGMQIDELTKANTGRA